MEIAIPREIPSLIIVNYTMLVMISLLISYVAANAYKQWGIGRNRVTTSDTQLKNYYKILT